MGALTKLAYLVLEIRNLPTHGMVVLGSKRLEAICERL